MNTYTTTREVTLLSSPALITCAMALVSGILYALVIPTLSVLLAERLSVRPMFVGAFFIAIALTSIVYAQSMANWSDRFSDRRRLIFIGTCSGGAASCIFAYSNSYTSVFLAAISFFSLASALMSQSFAHAREFSEQYLGKTDNTLFNSIFRACMAMGWVAGPPIGFASFNYFGPFQHYLTVGILFFILGFASLIFLPRVQKTDAPPVTHIENKSLVFILAIVAFSLLFGVNHSYIISLPLLINDSLGVPSSYAGYLMMTAAALEIPIMIGAGWLASKFSLLPLIRIGALSAVGLYIGLSIASSFWQLIYLQLFNAVFIGAISGLGMSWFQNMLPGRSGAASALFINCMNAGNVLGSIIVAGFAEAYGYASVSYINATLAAVAVCALFAIGVERAKTVS